MTKHSKPVTNPTGMDYNTDQAKMTISEYGRNVHRMIEHCMELEDREERNRCARSIIKVMSFLNPSLMQYADFNHKLWDHLFIMSDYALDVDSPYPKPTREEMTARPEPLKYPQSDIRFRHYGKIVEDLIRQACEEEDPKIRDLYSDQLAQLMKRQYLNWNRDSVNDILIVQQLEQLSKGKLKITENFKFLHTSEILPKNAVPQNQQPQYGTNKKKTFKKNFKKKY